MLATSMSRAIRPIPHYCSSHTSLTSTRITRLLYTRSHQRRNSSSSKPSGSANRPSTGPEQNASQVTASEVNREAEKKGPARLNRRRAKNSVAATEQALHEQARLNLPSVPSTHHLHPADVAVSAFFSLHRPISVTSSVPSTSNPTSFSTIFTPRTVPNHNPRNVIETLSSAVNVLDSAVHDNTPGILKGPANPRSGIGGVASTHIEIEAHDAASAASSPLQFPGHLLSGRYKPFTPPPIPTFDSSNSASPSADVEAQESSQKAYTTVLTIVESTDSTGEKTYSARATPIVSADGAEGKMEDPNTNSSVYIKRWREQMQMISVKRQRRLKMKKHKYKKLMKRTRNLRRRLDRN